MKRKNNRERYEEKKIIRNLQRYFKTKVRKHGRKVKTRQKIGISGI